MTSWVLGLIIGLSVAVVILLLCYVIARKQRKDANRSISEASKLRLLPENMPTGEGLPYTVYHNHYMGGWLQVLDGYPALSAFNVYNVTLDHIDTVFKNKRQPWCRTYKAACQIYGTGAGPKMIRQAIHAEHNALYRSKGVARTSKGRLYTGKELIALVNNGVSRGEMVFFTYVVLPNGEWHFSHTGRHPLRDGLSKHAVHANAAREVVYAGEFHIKDGVFIVDNSSGTFSPSKDDLPLIKELIEKNFPDLTVEAWDWQDPRLLADLQEAPSRSERVKKGKEVVETSDHTIVEMRGVQEEVRNPKEQNLSSAHREGDDLSQICTEPMLPSKKALPADDAAPAPAPTPAESALVLSPAQAPSPEPAQQPSPTSSAENKDVQPNPLVQSQHVSGCPIITKTPRMNLDNL